MAYTFFSVFASLYLMPLRLLHPLLRRLGLKNHFLPIDIVQKHYCRGFLYLCGVTVQWDGIEHLVSTARYIQRRQHRGRAPSWSSLTVLRDGARLCMCWL